MSKFERLSVEIESIQNSVVFSVIWFYCKFDVFTNLMDLLMKADDYTKTE